MNHPMSAALLGLALVVGCAGDEGGDDKTGETANEPTGADTGKQTGDDDETKDTGTQAASLNNCTFEGAEDLTGSATVTITDSGNDWRVPHQRCIVVDVGTTVTWEGDFGAHPLDGGRGRVGTVPQEEDPSSPIDVAGQGVGAGTPSIDVTFSAAGDFGYYCGIHISSMLGVVYVR